MIELYPHTAADSSGLWPVSTKGEIDLRKEFYDFLHGSTTETAKGHPVILRKMSRDSNGNLIKCSCVDEYTKEPDQDTICPYCWGVGNLWQEQWILTYSVVLNPSRGSLARREANNKAGKSNIPLLFYYIEYQHEPTKDDQIIEVKLDTEGNIVQPYKRKITHDIIVAEPFRSDTGRIEYWRCAVSAENIASTWWQNGS